MDREIYPWPLFVFCMKVSVIIPVYNQEHLLFGAIGSIPKRDDIEIIVVDDASMDRTWERLQAYIPDSGRTIKAFRNETNRGVGYARNIGLDNATGEYIYGLDSDDELITDAWESALDYLDGTDIVYVNGVSGDGTIWKVTDFTRDKYGAWWIKFMRREFIGNLRCPAIRWAEDKDFTHHLLRMGPIEKQTNITAYRYNWPRLGSLCWMENYGIKRGV